MSFALVYYTGAVACGLAMAALVLLVPSLWRVARGTAAFLWPRESAAGNTRCETGPQRLRRYD